MEKMKNDGYQRTDITFFYIFSILMTFDFRYTGILHDGGYRVMQKFSAGLLAMLVSGIFAASPVSASVKKIMMAPTKKVETKKTAAAKDSRPAKAIAKKAAPVKPAAKTSAKPANAKASAPAKGKTNPKHEKTVASKKGTVVAKHDKGHHQPTPVKPALKTASAKPVATKQTHTPVKTAVQHTPNKTASAVTKTAYTPTYSSKQPAVRNTYTAPVSSVHTASADPLPAFRTSGSSYSTGSAYNSAVPQAKPQSASVTPPISAFGKASSMPAVFNTPYNTSLPSKQPIYVNETPNGPDTRAKSVLVLDENNLKILYERNSTSRMSMASITKLMTALVVVESMQDMKEVLTITEDDIDHLKGTGSRLRIGTRLTRGEMLHLALMSSENRAASALGRYYPGGRSAFINAMNLKAAVLGMTNTRYVDSNGLSPQNVSCARDLAKLVMAAAEHPLIRKYSTAEYHTIYDGEKSLSYGSTNRLTHSSNWKIQVQKTGYIREAGQCLVMKTTIDGRPIVMVLLNVVGPKGARIVDAQNIKSWLAQDTSRSFFGSSRSSSSRSTASSFNEDDFYN